MIYRSGNARTGRSLLPGGSLSHLQFFERLPSGRIRCFLVPGSTEFRTVVPGRKGTSRSRTRPANGVNLAAVVEYCVFGFTASGPKEAAKKSSLGHQRTLTDRARYSQSNRGKG